MFNKETHTYRIMHKPSQSVVLITFAMNHEGNLIIASKEFIKGNVLDLVKFKEYAKFEYNKIMSAAQENSIK